MDSLTIISESALDELNQTIQNQNELIAKLRSALTSQDNWPYLAFTAGDLDLLLEDEERDQEYLNDLRGAFLTDPEGAAKADEACGAAIMEALDEHFRQWRATRLMLARRKMAGNE